MYLLNKKQYLIFIGFLIIMSVSAFWVIFYPDRYIELPSPRLVGESSLDECLSKTLNQTELTFTSLEIEELSQILWAGQGISDPVLKFRTTPSAGALYPIDLYVKVKEDGVNGLKEGLYLFAPEKHALVKKPYTDLNKNLASSIIRTDDRKLVEDSPICIVVTADYEITKDKYPNRGVRYVNLEVGCVAQNVYLQAAAFDFTVSFITEINVTEIQVLLDSETPLMIIPVVKSNKIISTSSKTKEITEPNIPLPKPTLNLEPSLENCIALRRSIREYGNEKLSIEDLSKILWSADSAPTHNVNIYLGIGEVDKLPQGVYKYISESHSLEKIHEKDVREELWVASGGEIYSGFNITYDWILDGKVSIILTINDGPNNDRLESEIEAGMVAMNIQLQVASMNLGTVTSGAFNDDQVLQAIKVSYPEVPVFIMPIGHRK